MKQVDESRIPAETLEIYRQLSRHGEARERVTEHNAADLAKLAERDGHTILAQELREWRANCPPPKEDEPPAG